MLVAAAAALALLALPGIASSHDRHHDQAGDAGTIQAFDPATGVLTVDLANGGSVSGLVTRRTHIRCDEEHGRGRHGRRDLRGGGRLSRHGDAEEEHQGRGEEPGEDEHNGRSEEPGEDTPGHDGTAPGSSEEPGQGAEHSDHCASDDLVAGTTVKVAELVLIDGSAIYRLIGLEPAPEAAPAT
jgi:hypothetical protein